MLVFNFNFLTFNHIAIKSFLITNIIIIIIIISSIIIMPAWRAMSHVDCRE